MPVYFPEVRSQVAYEGLDARTDLAFRHYRRGQPFGEQTAEACLGFALSLRVLVDSGADAWGDPAFSRAWRRGVSSEARQTETLQALRELAEKLTLARWAFWDRDLSEDGTGFEETRDALFRAVEEAAAMQEATGLKLAWGGADLARHPRYRLGALSTPDPHVFAYALAQSRAALIATHRLGGAAYLVRTVREAGLWPGLGFEAERERIARFLHLLAEEAARIGFQGRLLIECEPSGAHFGGLLGTLELLRAEGLEGVYGVQAGGGADPFALARTSRCGALGGLTLRSIGQAEALMEASVALFPSGTPVTLETLPSGASHRAVDLMHALVRAIDGMAEGWSRAWALREDERMAEELACVQAGWSEAPGPTSLEEAERWVLDEGEAIRRSGREDLLRNHSLRDPRSL